MESAATALRRRQINSLSPVSHAALSDLSCSARFFGYLNCFAGERNLGLRLIRGEASRSRRSILISWFQIAMQLYDVETLAPARAAESPAEVYARVFQELKPRTALPQVSVEFRRWANANSTIRLQEGQLEVRITDALDGAPLEIHQALARILLSKLFRRPVPPAENSLYRRFLNRKEMRRSLHLMRQIRGRKFVSGPQGRYYNLAEMFAELNDRFFHGLMAMPELGWSRQESRITLGHYDPSHNAIILSKLLDRSEVPRLVVEYVMYHEMLHLRFPVDHRGVRRCVHTREFRDAEKQFPSLREAKESIKRL